jgi:hypothetical protein
MRVIGCGHKGREANDDMQGAAFALGAAAIDCRLLLRGNEVSALWSYGLEMVTAKSQRLTAIAVGEQPEVADLDEATRQNVMSSSAATSSRLQTTGSLRRILGLVTSVSNQRCLSVRTYRNRSAET